MKNGYLLIFLLVIFQGCNSNSSTSSTTNKDLKEDFDSFYDRFHSDSAFQLARVRFPLNGGYFENGVDNNWTKENYVLIKTKIYDVDTTQFRTSYSKTDTTFIEKIWIEDSGFWVECGFKLIDDKWYLTTYNESDE